MDFKLFFEAKQKFVDRIDSAINKVDERPFEELFGNNERFLVKVYNPVFQNMVKSFDMELSNFDFNKRTYDGIPTNRVLKNKLNELRHQQDYLKKEIKQAYDKNKQDFLENHKQEYIEICHELAQRKVFFTKYEFASFVHGEPGRIKYTLMATNTSDNYSSIFRIAGPVGELKVPYEMDKPLTGKEIAEFVLDVVGGKYEYANITSIEYPITKLVSVMGNHNINVLEYKLENVDKDIKGLGKLKQAIDQNNIYYYLVFSRHPIDVMRMSDHRDISSCHRLDGAYAHCALADAQNNGGVIYLIKGSDASKIRNHLNDKEIWEDKDRGTGLIRPIGRTRIRRFVDTLTGKDFGVLAAYTHDQNYGYLTEDIYNEALKYARSHQAIYNSPPTAEYAYQNIIMVGGEYTDNYNPDELLNKFFGNRLYEGNKVKIKGNKMINFEQEMQEIFNRYMPCINNLGWSMSYEVHTHNHIKLSLNVPLEIIHLSMLSEEHQDKEYPFQDMIYNNPQLQPEILRRTIFQSRIVKHIGDNFYNFVNTSIIGIDTNAKEIHPKILTMNFRITNAFFEDPEQIANVLFDICHSAYLIKQNLESMRTEIISKLIVK